LVALVIDGQPKGHGVPPTDLSLKSGEPHYRGLARLASNSARPRPLEWCKSRGL